MTDEQNEQEEPVLILMFIVAGDHDCFFCGNPIDGGSAAVWDCEINEGEQHQAHEVCLLAASLLAAGGPTPEQMARAAGQAGMN